MMLRQPRWQGKLFKRFRQLAYLGSHPIEHRECDRAVRASGFASPLVRFKYLGSYLALSMRTADRRRALASHYRQLHRRVSTAFRKQLGDGILLWEREIGNGEPPLRIILEPAILAPMEGELQLRFAFRSDLFVLTFMLADGQPFNSDAASLLFIGGAQGGYYRREETREAAKLNGEIAPSAMLMVAVQELAKALEVEALIAVSGKNHVSNSYAASQILLDFDRLWSEVGGIADPDYYRLPQENMAKSLAEVAKTHRSRARRKREAKALIRRSIEEKLSALLRRPSEEAVALPAPLVAEPIVTSFAPPVMARPMELQASR